MPTSPPLRLALAVLAALALVGGALAWPYARRVAGHFSPRADAALMAVSADGTRMILVEYPSLRAFLLDGEGEHPLDAGIAARARLGAGVAYVAAFDLLHRPRGSFFGLEPRCDPRPAPEEPWSMPVWRADGRAMLRRTPAGIVLDGPEACAVVGAGWTSAAFVGDGVVGTDGGTVRIDGAPLWRGTAARLMMASGSAWVLAAEGFGAVDAAGVRLLETKPGLASVWEMPHGVCLVDDSPGFVVPLDTPTWGSRCWRDGRDAGIELPRGWVPVDVDLAYDPDTRALRDFGTGAARVLPAGFPVASSTRALPDGTLRTFHEQGYWQLTVDDVLTERRWSEGPPSLRCADCAASRWRAPAEIGGGTGFEP